MQEEFREESPAQSAEPIARPIGKGKLYAQLFKKAEGKGSYRQENNAKSETEGEVNPKDLLVEVINDDSRDVTNKKDFYNKLLRKAVFWGNVDMVELILTETRGIGMCVVCL